MQLTTKFLVMSNLKTQLGSRASLARGYIFHPLEQTRTTAGYSIPSWQKFDKTNCDIISHSSRARGHRDWAKWRAPQCRSLVGCIRCTKRALQSEAQITSSTTPVLALTSPGPRERKSYQITRCPNRAQCDVTDSPRDLVTSQHHYS